MYQAKRDQVVESHVAYAYDCQIKSDQIKKLRTVYA